MIKKTIKYVDYNDQPQEEVCWFHLNKQELGNLQMKMNGHYIDYLQALAERKKVEGLYQFLYNLILDSYGVRDLEGKRFIKSPEIRTEFEQSIPFGEFLYELIQDGDAIAQFIDDVMPKGIEAKSAAKVVDVTPKIEAGNAASQPEAK